MTGKLRPRTAYSARPSYRKETPNTNTVEARAASDLDDIALFQDLQKTLIPELRKAIAAGKDTKTILEIGKAAALARLVSLATLDTDSKTALSAIKEMLDRLEGKSTEKKEISHRLAKLADEEVDALLLTSVSDLEDGENN